jgi:hypothetical protein
MTAQIIPFPIVPKPSPANPKAIVGPTFVNDHKVHPKFEWNRIVFEQRTEAEKEVAAFKKLGDLIDHIIAQSGKETAAEFVRAASKSRDINVCLSEG